MKSWTISEARAHIADVVDAALEQGPQRIERRDSRPVVVVAEDVWQRLAAEYPSFGDIVLDAPIERDDLPPRRPARVLGQQS